MRAESLDQYRASGTPGVTRPHAAHTEKPAPEAAPETPRVAAPPQPAPPPRQPVITVPDPIESTFEYDRHIQRLIITMRSADGEVVRQIPSRQAVQLLAATAASATPGGDKGGV
jgi:hypothetical protein